MLWNNSLRKCGKSHSQPWIPGGSTMIVGTHLNTVTQSLWDNANAGEFKTISITWVSITCENANGENAILIVKYYFYSSNNLSISTITRSDFFALTKFKFNFRSSHLGKSSEKFFGYESAAQTILVSFGKLLWKSAGRSDNLKIYCFYNVVKIEHYYSFTCQIFILHVDFDLRNSI